MYMGLSFVFAGATQVVDVAKDVQKSIGKAERKIHKNSLEYVGDTHVYSIHRVADGKAHKVGQSSQGYRKGDVPSKRAEQQARRLQRETNELYETKIRKLLIIKRKPRL